MAELARRPGRRPCWPTPSGTWTRPTAWSPRCLTRRGTWSRSARPAETAQRPGVPGRPADMAAIAERVAAAMSGPARQRRSLLRPPPSSPHDAPWTRPVTWASAPTTCPRRTATRQRPSRTSATAASTRSCTAATAPPPQRTGASAGCEPPERPATASSTSWTSSPKPAWPPTSSRWRTSPTAIRASGIRCAIRGSGAGSFVNHLLGISAIDPLEHGLLMERFLSPIRKTLPGHRP